MRLLCVVPLVILGTERSASCFVPSYRSIQPRQLFQRTSASRKSYSTSVCNLFFRSGEVPLTKPRRRPVASTLLEELRSPTLSLPFDICLSDDQNHTAEEALTIRHMKPEDLDEVIKLCTDEFGSGPTASLLEFPWNQPGEIPDWWDRVYFEPSIRFALLAKMNENSKSNEKLSKDPAILVLTRGKEQAEVVGLVEISLQPPQADRNPPTYPRPLEMKSLYSRMIGVELEGWVTNLLVDQKCRGFGYSKVLMAATEGIARSWGRKYIYLHADANLNSGRVPQALYESLGYEIVTTSDPQYEWMPKSAYSSIQMVNGVALLFYRKKL